MKELTDEQIEAIAAALTPEEKAMLMWIGTNGGSGSIQNATAGQQRVLRGLEAKGLIRMSTSSGFSRQVN